jgi:hypothetical protein
MPSAKPNDVKLLRAEFSVREFMTLCTSSELVVDRGMKGIMLSLRKLMSNGSAMKGSMKRFVFEKMMVQLRWVSNAPNGLASMNEGNVPATNEYICLIGSSTLCAGAAVFNGQPQLLEGALRQFDNLAASAAQIAAWCMLATSNVATYTRLRPTYWHPGRTMCTAAHDAANARRQSGRSDVTPMHRGTTAWRTTKLESIFLRLWSISSPCTPNRTVTTAFSAATLSSATTGGKGLGCCATLATSYDASGRASAARHAAGGGECHVLLLCAGRRKKQ